ncbi:SulP family inorganic anion transporter [Sphingosinicella rhizophila]|uniref:SulP family inorganic anion transporter n=1 Tax=Sphingosinicella rhizophila TaxID=3050082 RepID=A0ABU3QBS5_9SPHN|nr:SulP family inorganic anion transporter [Sphingosinicella sp. GR2756]MDT9600849.1 SulP family inorganic anion transporter [Sphingosinicella sp. GR2756]
MPQAFTPKLWTVLRGGYASADFRADAIAGLTVAIVALPLAMALAIASGASPDKGLITAVVAGLLISSLGGSRVQIGGPTAAFVVVVFNVIATHGYDGLVLATLMAGAILTVAGLVRFGQIIKFIPHPVVTGFTAGIAIIIASSQVKDFLGLAIPNVPAEFVEKWIAYFDAIATVRPETAGVGLASLLIILATRRISPRLPAYLFAVVVAAAAVALLKLPVETIGSRFPNMPTGIPAPSIPTFSLVKAEEVLPSAFTIAFLAGIEALLSCVVADGMTGFRHRSNQELIGQGVANVASAMFGGLPATGAIARTATNVKSGGRTPVAGIMHAVFILLFMLFATDVMSYVPMAVLAAILFVVAWGMSEAKRFFALLKMPMGERAVLLITFGLTVFLDLTVAIGVGVTLASLMFMAKMSEAGGVVNGRAMLNEQDADAEDVHQRDALPNGVEVFQILGPFFFGVAGELLSTLRGMGEPPRIIVLRMRLVPYLDASGTTALEDFVHEAHVADCKVILSGVRKQPMEVLNRAGLGRNSDRVSHASNYLDALAMIASADGKASAD